MEENNKNNEEKVVENQVGTQANENKDEGKAFKTFQTEAEYNKAVNSILKSKLPPKEEMDAFKNWKDSQKTAEQKQAEKEAEYLKKDNLISNLEKENAILKAGVKEDVDYVLFKVGKMEGDFKENLAKFLKENPKYTSKETVIKTVGTSAKLDGTTRTENTTNQIMNDLIRSSRD